MCLKEMLQLWQTRNLYSVSYVDVSSYEVIMITTEVRNQLYFLQHNDTRPRESCIFRKFVKNSH